MASPSTVLGSVAGPVDFTVATSNLDRDIDLSFHS